MELGRSAWKETRVVIQDLVVRRNISSEHFSKIFIPIADLKMQLPVHIGDYTDFYASKEHATNVGRMFRGEENALMPNWYSYIYLQLVSLNPRTHMPIGYHGRASSITVSPSQIQRPWGQTKLGEASPTFSTCAKLDFELEMVNCET